MSDRKIYIFGGGGHARVIASILDRDATFVVPTAEHEGELSEADFFDRVDDIRTRADVYLGLGSNSIRRKIFGLAKTAELRLPNCIAPSVFVARDAEFGEGVVVCHGSVIGSRAILRDNTIVNTISSVDHDCELGAHTQITAGVTLGGTVKIGSNCFLGVKTAVVPYITIGSNVQVMAGSIITKSVPNSVLVGGNPARLMKEL